MIELKVEELAREARVSENTITRFERGHGEMRRATADVVRRVMEARGARFGEDGITVSARREPAEQQAA